MSARTPVLEVEGLVKHFPLGRGVASGGAVVRAVDGVSFSLAEGEVLGLVGESGSGKTTVGYCVNRLLEPTAGSIKLDGTEIGHLSRRELRPLRRLMHIVFQDPYSSLNPRMTCGQIVGEPIRLQRLARRSALDARVADLFDAVGLRSELRHRYPHELSGGQRQRVGLARALSVSPRLLIADEPVSALDVSVQAAVLNLLRDLQREYRVLVPVHQPRPRHGRVPLRPGGRDVPGQDRRGCVARRPLRAAAAPLHAGVAVRCRDPRPGGAAYEDAGRPRRRHPEPDLAAFRLSLQDPVSARARVGAPLDRRGAGAGRRDRARAPGGMPPRRTGPRRAADRGGAGAARRGGAALTFTTRPELRGTFGMVASTHWLASAAGMAVLERGGNAFDAAVATGLTLQVVEPHLNGPGGDLPVVLWSAERGEPLVRLRAGHRAGGGVDRAVPRARPRARPRDWSPRCVRPRRVRRLDAAAAGVRDARARGRPRLCDRLCGGRLPGRTRDHRHDRGDAGSAGRLAGLSGAVSPRAASRHALPEPGARCDLRRILEEAARGTTREDRIERARATFYEGFVAEAIDRFSAEQGGLLSGDDLARWRATTEPPVTFDYHGHTVCKTAPGARARSSSSSSRCSPVSTSPQRSSVSADYIHTSSSAPSWPSPTVRRSTAIPSSSTCRSSGCSRRRTTTSGAVSWALRRPPTCVRAAVGCRRRSRPRRRRGGRADARRHGASRRRRPLREPGLGDAERRVAPSLAGDRLSWAGRSAPARRCSGWSRDYRRRSSRASVRGRRSRPRLRCGTASPTSPSARRAATSRTSGR